MKYFLLSVLVLSGLFFLVTCGDDGLDAYSYGNCKTGKRRCTGTKLEVCNDYEEWMLIADCAEAGGECIYEKGDYYCSEEFEQTPDTIVEWEDEEETPDEGGGELKDNFGSVSDDDPDEEDSDDLDQPDQSDESEISDDFSDDSDSDLDEDIADDDVVPVCGNGVLEGNEICEKNDVKDCTEIDSEKFTAGKAICDDTCMSYNTITCVE